MFTVTLEQAKTCHNIFQKNYLIQNTQSLKTILYSSACLSRLQAECTRESDVQQAQGCYTDYLEISSKCKFKEGKKTRLVPHTVPLLSFRFILIIWTNLFTNYSTNEISQGHINCNIKGDHRPSCQIPGVGCCTKPSYFEGKKLNILYTDKCEITGKCITPITSYLINVQQISVRYSILV